MPGRLTTDVEPVGQLSHATQQRLHSVLTQYNGLREQIDLLEGLADAERQQLQAILEEDGIDKALIDGFNVAIVRGTSSSLDKKKLVALGVTEAQLAMATTTKPKKPYVAVRKAGEKGDGD